MLERDDDFQVSGSRGIRLIRRCLACLALFDSAWAGERICPRCKHSAHWRTGFDDTPA